LRQSIAQVQAPDIKSQLDTEHFKEVLDVFRRLRERLGYARDAPVTQFGELAESALVAVRDLVNATVPIARRQRIGGPVLQFAEPVPLR
jgi:hypothetical protein